MESKDRFPVRVDDNVAVWAEFRELVEKYNGISLGEGAPGYNPPTFVRDEIVKAIDEGHNQYTRTFGQLNLVNKVAEIYGKKLGRVINPLTEVFISPGANTALNNYITAIIRPGEQEEIVYFEPCWPCYFDHIQMAGAVFRPIPLEFKEGDWNFDVEQFKASFNSKTKIFILNNAQNPTGKLFSRAQLELMTKILEDFPNVIILSDEVYDFLNFDDGEFIRFATIGDNFKKTLSIYSGGKLFNASGWKVGWTIGPAELVRLGAIVGNTIVYCVNLPAQQAMANSLERTEKGEYKDGLTYVEFTKKCFQDNRDFMFKGFSETDLPLVPLKTESGYFLMVDISKCKDLIPKRYTESHEYEVEGEGNHNNPVQKNRIFMPDGRVPLDLAFSRWMAIERRVVVMPNVIFYSKGSPFANDNFVRVAICKTHEHNEIAVARLQNKK